MAPSNQRRRASGARPRQGRCATPAPLGGVASSSSSVGSASAARFMASPSHGAPGQLLATVGEGDEGHDEAGDDRR